MGADRSDAPRIDGFEDFVPIGSGGTAVVWSARQTALGREVAVKTLDPSLVSGDEQIDRFQSEARTAARLSHPGVVRVFDAFYRDGRFCIVMEKLEGETLARRIASSGPVPEREVFETAKCVVSALQYAWERERLVHCDLKPDNVMLSPDGTAKVMDFGLSRSVFSLQARRPGGDGPPEWVWGTPAYMSPEQALGRDELTPRSDMYSLGATLYHALTGRRLFDGVEGGESAVMEAQVSSVDASPREIVPSISLPACDFVERLLAKDPENRFSDWAEVGRAVASLAAGTARRRDFLLPGRTASAGDVPFSTVRRAKSLPPSAVAGLALQRAEEAAERLRAAAERAGQAVLDAFSGVAFRPSAASLAFFAVSAAALGAAFVFDRSRVAAFSKFVESADAVLAGLGNCPEGELDGAIAWCDGFLASPEAAADETLFACAHEVRAGLRKARDGVRDRELARVVSSWDRVLASDRPGAAAAVASGLRAYSGPYASLTAAGRERLAKELESGGAQAVRRGTKAQ